MPGSLLQVARISGTGVARVSGTHSCFLHWIFVHPWNRFIHICGREAELVWLEDAAQPSRGLRALFPGDAIPD
jgi:hypothetical protein